jgi:hypothetical protein
MKASFPLPRRLARAELSSFASRVGGRGATEPSPDYLVRSRVTGLFSGGSLVGGFVLASPPERSVEMMSPGALSALSRVLGESQATDCDLTELTCVWRDTELRSLWARLWLWAVIVAWVVLYAERYVVAFCRKPKLQPIYELCHPKVVWESAPASTRHLEREVVYLFTRTDLLFGLLRYPAYKIGKGSRLCAIERPSIRAASRGAQ